MNIKQFIKGDTREITGFEGKKKSNYEEYLPQLPRKLRNCKKVTDGETGKLVTKLAQSILLQEQEHYAVYSNDFGDFR